MSGLAFQTSVFQPLESPIFDTREKASGLIYRLVERNLPHRIDTLLIGDCAVSSRVCFEIKRISRKCNDVKASLFDDRIHYQSKDRQENYLCHILIIEFSGEQAFDQAFTQQHMQTLLDTLIIDFNTHIEFTKSMDETIDVIYRFWKHECEKGQKVLSATNKTPRPKTHKEQQIYFLSGLLGVGDKIAQNLLDVLKSPIEVIRLICTTEISYTATGNPRPLSLPEGLKGIGVAFIQQNQKLLLQE